MCLVSDKYQPKKVDKVGKWESSHAKQITRETEDNNNLAFYLFNFYRPSCNFGVESLFCTICPFSFCI
jgi:hypothetical protein